MRAFKVFIFGLLYGWFIKIAVDQIYRKNEIEDIRNENRSLKEYIRYLELQLEPKSLESKSARRERIDLQAEPKATPAAAPVASASEKDDLKVIKGIGPAIEKKLNSAGIYTFAALARLNNEELENILGTQVKRLQNENNLIAQAQKLAQQKR